MKYLYILTLLSSTLLFAQEKPEIKVGGALRFNYNLSTWKKEQVKRGGDFGYDLFRINAVGKYKGISLNAEYRLYSAGFGGGMLKQGWLGYDFDEKNKMQLGLTQVPFGNTQYNSNNWFFSINYYLGLEDDHDMGIKFTHRGEKWDYDLAFFKNAEELQFGNLSDLSPNRYSYDIGSIDADGDGKMDLRNKEVNQLNAKVVYKIKGNAEHRIGASAMYGGVLNLDTEKIGNHKAFSVHYEMKNNKLGLKLQGTYSKTNPKNPDNKFNNVVAMSAYGGNYLTPAEFYTYTGGVSYDIPVKFGPVSQLQLYNDFGMVDKINSDFQNTYMNVTGVMISAGNVYIYVDMASGKNMPWLNPDFTNSLAKGSSDNSDKWHTRYNINIGYYF